jgi:dTDP-4-amino-4,6-dideoxygalactose transaminase
MNEPIVQEPLAFIDLQKQRARLDGHIDRAIQRVLSHGQFIMGPEVGELEAALCEFCGASHTITCSNGTDALGLILMALGLASGDAVLCPSFTFAATAEVVAWFGAMPVFVDVDEDTFNVDPASLEIGIKSAKDRHLRPVGVISVDLFGQPADYDRIEAICAAHGLWLLSDAAQSFGAAYKGRNVGTIGTATATSFYPAKPLGCYGDGGAVMTNNAELAAVLKSVRVHGEGRDKYDNVRVGMNGRLDTLQAAILIEKLRIFRDEIEQRDQIAMRYNEQLAAVARVPRLMDGVSSVWAQYTICVPSGRRGALAAALRARGIPTAVFYAKPLHQQTAYQNCLVAGNGLPVTERIAGEVISLPMHAYLDESDQQRIIEAVKAELD